MFAAQQLSYRKTGAFSKIVMDYLDAHPQLQPFYQHTFSKEGLNAAMAARDGFATQRNVLVQVLKAQYTALDRQEAVWQNIEALSSAHTYTITTAHQPNLLTGPLYFLYKILHAIKLAHWCKDQMPDKHFVPVFYMGSEDADLDELNHFTVAGKRYVWPTKQKGAVGRMFVDDALIKLIGELEQQIGIAAHGPALIAIFKKHYRNGNTIQQATQALVHELFGRFGLVVLVADDPRLKQQMQAVFADDLFTHQPCTVVQQTCQQLEQHYEVQAHPRPINLFYLEGDTRERLEATNDGYKVVGTPLHFSRQALKDLLTEHPERFSPNVILRGLYQETILPNIAFVGGGGELAYWLQLKDLFVHYRVPYPVLILRNSFLLAEEKWKLKTEKLGLQLAELFEPEGRLMERIVSLHSNKQVRLNGQYRKAEDLYKTLEQQALDIDSSLQRHVLALKARGLKQLQALEKKMLRAEKRKFSEHQAAIQTIKAALFPKNGLQERVENFSALYAHYGPAFLDILYRYSQSLDQVFTVLVMDKNTISSESGN